MACPPDGYKTLNVLIAHCLHATIILCTHDLHVLQDLLPLLPGAIAGEIESKAANLNNLVVEAYKVCMYNLQNLLKVNFYYHFVTRYEAALLHLARSDRKNVKTGNLELGYHWMGYKLARMPDA